MFTGAIYLCSVLHYAPAEPPAKFIRIILTCTKGFPIILCLLYTIVRTIYEASPLKLMIGLPFSYLIGSDELADYLWATQLDCWLTNAKLELIEGITEFPNLVLVVVSGASTWL